MPKGTFLDCCSQCPCTFGEALLTHPSIGDPPTLAGSFWFSLLWDHCSFPLGLGMCKTLLVPSKTGGLFPPVFPPVKVLSSDLAGLQGQIPLEIPRPFVRAPGWKAWCGVQHLHSSGRFSSGYFTAVLLLVLLFCSLWVIHLTGMGFDFIVIAPLLLTAASLSLDVAYLVMVRPCVLSITQQVGAILLLS